MTNGHCFTLVIFKPWMLDPNVEFIPLEENVEEQVSAYLRNKKEREREEREKEEEVLLLRMEMKILRLIRRRRARRRPRKKEQKQKRRMNLRKIKEMVADKKKGQPKK